VLVEELRADEKLAGWLRDLESGGEPRAKADLPDAIALVDVLLDLSVPHECVNELVALRARLAADPEALTLLGLCVDRFVRDMGKIGGGWEPPVFPESTGALGRTFQVFVFIAALPYVRAYHRQRDIPADVSRRTLADLGRNLAVHRRRTGTTGLLVPWWIGLHFHGELYQLGRLQFDLRRRNQVESGLPPEYGEWLLDVHIPEAGPLTPDAVGVSLQRAVTFFGEHFPDRPVRAAVCASWLLDPYLGRHLDPSSNMVSFQRLFTAFGEPRDDQLDAVYFTFGQRSLDGFDQLPRQSSLQRLVLERVASGQRWQVVHGYRELP